MFSKCRVCNEKDARISDLQSYIAKLEKLAFPHVLDQRQSFEAQEMDRLISGSDEPIEVEDDAISQEAAALLMGSYDHSQVEIE